MGRVRVSLELPAQVSFAEGLWYDVSRWPNFIDGFAHVRSVEGEWPGPGARVLAIAHERAPHGGIGPARDLAPVHSDLVPELGEDRLAREHPDRTGQGARLGDLLHAAQPG